MSDWGATHSTAPSIIAGLDLEMPYGVYFDTPLYQSVYVAKNISETYVNRALGHLLGMYEDYGLLGRPSAVTAPLQQPLIDQSASLAYDIAVRSGVLLKNDDSALPIDFHKESFAVFGPNGLVWYHGAGFAERAYGFRDREISVYKALQSRIGSTSIASAVGTDRDGSVIPEGSLLSLNGSAGLSRNDSTGVYTVDPTIDFSGSSALAANTSYEWNGYLKCDETGYYRLSLQREYFATGDGQNASAYSSFSASSLTLNGSEIAAGYRFFLDGGIRPWSTPMATADGWDNIGNYVFIDAGTHPIQITLSPVLDQNVTVRLNWVTPSQREANIQRAVSIAQTVDKPIVFAYANSPAQTPMTLDDGGDELIERISAANPNTVVVLNNAEPVMMPWLSKVKAVLQMFHPGQEGGWATADLLLGKAPPKGRLPITYPTSVNTSMTRNPAFPGRVNGPNGTANFSEGLNIGYRWYKESNTPVLFPFGFGLSFTNFSYGDLAVTQSGHGLKVSFWLENVGCMAGTEVPQVYVGPPSNTEAYPGILFAAQVLIGFETFDLQAGQRLSVEFDVDERWLSFYNQTNRQWVLPKGTRTLWVGASAQETILSTTVTF
jgi:beta-glucosidase